MATGNWGCGAFGGESRLKALLQLMVCASVSRPLVYFTFGDRQLRTEFLQIYQFLRGGVTVAQLWSYLKRFRDQRLSAEQLYAFIQQMHQDRNVAVVVYGVESVKLNICFSFLFFLSENHRMLLSRFRNPLMIDQKLFNGHIKE